MPEEIQDTVPEEAIIPQEELDLELELDNTEDVEALKAELEKTKTFARQTNARAKKAEEELKALKKPVPTPVTQTVPANPQASVEETVLLVNGMPEELVEKLKVISKVNNVSLIKAQTDPIFIAIKEGYEKELKQKDASLPVSRGSGQQKPKKDFKTPGLTEAERKEMFEAQFNR